MDATTNDATTDAMSDAMRTTDAGAARVLRSAGFLLRPVRTMRVNERTTDDDDDDRGCRFLRVTNGSFVISRARFTAG